MAAAWLGSKSKTHFSESILFSTIIEASLTLFTLVIDNSERDMPGIEPGSLEWHISSLTAELQELRQKVGP